MNFYERALELQEETVAHRRYFHTHAEVGLNMPRVQAYVMEKLTEYGLCPQKCGHGVAAVLGHGGKVLLLRADMDALPMPEESGEAFACPTGTENHACGHDFHAAMLLTAAKMLKEQEDRLEGTVKFMFQPAEETFEGSKDMIAAGILDNPKVDAALAYHVAAGRLPMGLYMYNDKDAMMFSVDGFRITVFGKGSHGAYPQNAIDPINIGVHIHLALQELIAREISATEPVVLTLGSIHSGDAPNVIPNDCTISGTLRAFNPDVRNFAKKRMEEVIQATANMFRGKAEIHYITETPPVVNTPDFAVEMQQYIRDVIGEDCITKGPRIMGSDDFAYYNEQRPGAMFHIGMGTKEEGHTCALHNPGVWFDEKSIAICAGAMANCCVNWLKNHKED